MILDELEQERLVKKLTFKQKHQILAALKASLVSNV